MGCTVHAKVQWLLPVALALATVGSVAAQEAKKELLVDYVPSVLWQPEPIPLQDSLREEDHPGPASEDGRPSLLVRHSKLTLADRWDKFEDEFGIRHREDSLFKHSIQEAKYTLDEVAFVVHELTKAVEDALRFEYDLRELTRLRLEKNVRPRIYADPWSDFLDSARLKSDIHLDAFHRDAYVGMKFLFPFGD